MAVKVEDHEGVTDRSRSPLSLRVPWGPSRQFPRRNVPHSSRRLPFIRLDLPCPCQSDRVFANHRTASSPRRPGGLRPQSSPPAHRLVRPADATNCWACKPA